MSEQAPPLADYGLIGDCHGAALVSRAACIDWCCLPRLDSGSCFGRLLDWEQGGCCSISVSDAGPQAEGSNGRPASYDSTGQQCYVKDTLVLQTSLAARTGSLRVSDFFAMPRPGEHPDGQGGGEDPGKADTGGADGVGREIVRIAECTGGMVEVQVQVAPRFDYGAVRPWLRRVSADTFTAIGGDDGLVVWSDGALAIDEDGLSAHTTLHAGERLRLVIRFARPHLLEDSIQGIADPARADALLEQTVAWWRAWRERVKVQDPDHFGLVRSAITLKALTYAPTGAIAAAATTSLPETPKGQRNWDYRFSWIRDSTLAAHALAEVGCEADAERFRHFIVRSSAGHAEDLQILYGIGGERRTIEQELELSGYRGAKPVRAGNEAARQLQLDAFGEVLNLGYRWHLRGRSPDDDEWRFFSELVEAAIKRWSEPDHGIWEWRGRPQHFVHSKAACWAAVDRGVRLAQECLRKAPVRRWRTAANEIRQEIEARGYDKRKGVFVQRFDGHEVDCSLLLLPVMGFVEWDDERMVRTADAIQEKMADGGFLRRYKSDDTLPGVEGAFVPCSFWLAECYARQGRSAQAREAFDQAMTAANHLGLFSEEVQPRSGEMLGNLPQALTHLSHISAAVALMQAGGENGERREGVAAEVVYGAAAAEEQRG